MRAADDHTRAKMMGFGDGLPPRGDPHVTYFGHQTTGMPEGGPDPGTRVFGYFTHSSFGDNVAARNPTDVGTGANGFSGETYAAPRPTTGLFEGTTNEVDPDIMMPIWFAALRTEAFHDDRPPLLDLCHKNFLARRNNTFAVYSLEQQHTYHASFPFAGIVQQPFPGPKTVSDRMRGHLRDFKAVTIHSGFTRVYNLWQWDAFQYVSATHPLLACLKRDFNPCETGVRLHMVDIPLPKALPSEDEHRQIGAYFNALALEAELLQGFEPAIGAKNGISPLSYMDSEPQKGASVLKTEEAVDWASCSEVEDFQNELVFGKLGVNRVMDLWYNLCQGREGYDPEQAVVPETMQRAQRIQANLDMSTQTVYCTDQQRQSADDKCKWVMESILGTPLTGNQRRVLEVLWRPRARVTLPVPSRLRTPLPRIITLDTVRGYTGTDELIGLVHKCGAQRTTDLPFITQYIFPGDRGPYASRAGIAQVGTLDIHLGHSFNFH